MKNSTVKIKIVDEVSSNGQYPIVLRVSKNRKKKDIRIGIKCKKEQFENEQLKRSFPNYKISNELILTYKTKALQIIREYELANYDFTLKEFEQKFKGQETSDVPNFITFMEMIISELDKSDKVSNTRTYRETKNLLVRYDGNDITFNKIDVGFLEKFEAYLRENNNTSGGVAFRMRVIRAIFNEAIQRRIISQEIYPFKFYKISKLKSIKNKRALTEEEFVHIRNLDLKENPLLTDAYHYFMFSFYTRGMNFADIMKLKWEDIKEGRIYYVRSKTKVPFNIEILPPVQEILNYYWSEQNTGYVFPILSNINLSAKQIDYRKKKVLAKVNKDLKEIAHLAKIKKVLTTYVARHSFATILKKKGASIEKISELMGHSDVHVTMNYLKEFDNEVLDSENRKLLDL